MFMLHRIRLAMDRGRFSAQMVATIAADETFISGKARNKHAGYTPKTPVLSLINPRRARFAQR
jgi:hypothetical protein